MNISLDAPLKVKGDELLSKVKKLARQCGYYSTTENGIEKVNMSQFLNALLDTKEIEKEIELEHIYHKKNRGRSASYKITVQSNGNIVIGSSYTQKMGLKPGDEFEITLGRKHIHLKQINREEENSFMMSSFLDFITEDAIQNPENLVPYTEEMSQQIDLLLAGVELEYE